jgi:hypothetical protein
LTIPRKQARLELRRFVAALYSNCRQIDCLQHSPFGMTFAMRVAVSFSLSHQARALIEAVVNPSPLALPPKIDANEVACLKLKAV